MPCCAIITCRARSQTSSIERYRISFHRFPKEAELKEQWIEVTGRENWFPTKSSTICSKHFTEGDFIIKKSGNRYLKPEATPSEKIVHIHTGSPALHNTCNTRTSNMGIATRKEEKRLISTNLKKKIMSSSNASTLRKIKMLKIIKNKDCIIRNQKLKINQTQALNRRLKMKIIETEEILNKFQEKFTLQIDDVPGSKNLNNEVQELIACLQHVLRKRDSLGKR